jgi:hypothetical protein
MADRTNGDRLTPVHCFHDVLQHRAQALRQLEWLIVVSQQRGAALAFE